MHTPRSMPGDVTPVLLDGQVTMTFEEVLLPLWSPCLHVVPICSSQHLTNSLRASKIFLLLLLSSLQQLAACCRLLCTCCQQLPSPLSCSLHILLRLQDLKFALGCRWR